MASVIGSPTRAPSQDAGASFRAAPAVAAALAAIAILAAYAPIVASIVAIWRRSETFAHGFVVVPIALWLAWRKRREIAAVPAKPWTPGLVLVGAAGAAWLVTASAEVLGLNQFALAFMVQAAIVTVVGLQVARAAAFPLLFVLFAVPAGELLVPTLIDWTADFTVAALRLSGVPVFREANHFVIPSGAWSVVEACSGLRYLIASFMIGVVYAAIAYRSPWRRAAFIAASILVPILANWLRAYIIVMIGHLSDNRLAVGVDHLIYGWVFFGLVMGLLFWIGSTWSEREPASAEDVPAHPAHATHAARPAAAFFVAAAAAVAVAVPWRPVFASIERPPSAVVPQLARLAGGGGFVPAEREAPAWTPSYKGQAAVLRQSFERDGAAAWLYVAYYRNQAKGRELVTSGNQLVGIADHRWREVERSTATVTFDGRDAQARRSTISGPRERLVAYSLLWVDGTLTSSEYAAKALLSWSKLRGGAGDAALVVVYARDDRSADVAAAALRALSPELATMLAQARERR